MRFLSVVASLPLLFMASLTTAVEVLGPVHPIVEPDMVEGLKARAAAQFTPEVVAAIAKEKEDTTRKYAERPTGVVLPRTEKAATRWYNPAITVPYDLRDQDGRLIHAAGTTINPLDVRPLTRQMLFFNGDDEDQVKWAERTAAKAEWRVKPILVSGSPRVVAGKWQRMVSFDQRGLLAEKLGIKQVPAIVLQDGARLRIEEVLP